MSNFVIHPTTANWLQLVEEATNKGFYSVTEEAKSYLIFLLQRFIEKTQLAEKALGVDYLEACQNTGVKKQEALRDVGDSCLLFSGFFPERASKRNVPIDYFVEIGQGAYQNLSVLLKDQEASCKLYDLLSKQFIYLMDVLHGIRELNGNSLQLSPLEAEKLWEKTGSFYALRILKKQVKNTFFSSSFKGNLQ